MTRSGSGRRSCLHLGARHWSTDPRPVFPCICDTVPGPDAAYDGSGRQQERELSDLKKMAEDAMKQGEKDEDKKAEKAEDVKETAADVSEHSRLLDSSDDRFEDAQSPQHAPRSRSQSSHHLSFQVLLPPDFSPAFFAKPHRLRMRIPGTAY